VLVEEMADAITFRRSGTSCPDAVAIALKQTGVTKAELAAAVETCKGWNSAILESSTGCVHVSLELRSAEQINRFSYWLTLRGHLVRSMSLWQARHNDIAVDDPGSQIGFALGLKLAKQTGMLCPLQFYHSDLLSSPVVIKELPSNSLTKLHLCGDGLDPNNPNWSPAATAAAIGTLTSLRSLILGPPRTLFMPGEYLSSISGLSQLTELRAIDMDPEDTFPYLALFPQSLAALQVVMALRKDLPDSPTHVDLTHLSSLTALSFTGTLTSSSRLPPSVTNLAVPWQRDSTTSFILQLPHLHSLILGPGPGINLESIAKLTTVTHLELVLDGSDQMTAAAPFLEQLPNLHRLDMEYGSEPQAVPSRLLFTPAFFSQLGAATSLTSLRFSWAEDDRSFIYLDKLEGFTEQLAKLEQLCCLRLSCLPLGVSAHHLSVLTRLTSLELCSCKLRNFAVSVLGCKLKNLKHLSLDSNDDLSDSCTPTLGQLTQLSSLKLQGVAITKMGLMQLTTLRQLQHLQLSVDCWSTVRSEDLDNFWDALRAGRNALGA
jgi:hypothetical protein